MVSTITLGVHRCRLRLRGRWLSSHQKSLPGSPPGQRPSFRARRSVRSWRCPNGSTPRSHRGQLERAYDDFISTGSVATLRPVVADSWRLSRASGVSPDGVLPVVDMLDAELEAYRSAHPLAAVMPLIRRLLIEEAEDAGAIVVVADADSRLLWVEGDATLRRLAEGMNWVAGSRWDERTTGTNAPAAAMRLNHALQVFAREHYASNVAAWSCTAAPIHDPTTGRILGALDITGRDDVAAPAVLGLVRAAVAAAESELRMRAMYQPVTRKVAEKRSAPPRTAPAQLLSVLGRDRAMLARQSAADGAGPSCRSGTPNCCSCSPSTPRATPPISWPSRCTSGMSPPSPCAPN